MSAEGASESPRISEDSTAPHPQERTKDFAKQWSAPHAAHRAGVAAPCGGTHRHKGKQVIAATQCLCFWGGGLAPTHPLGKRVEGNNFWVGGESTWGPIIFGISWREFIWGSGYIRLEYFGNFGWHFLKGRIFLRNENHFLGMQ